MSGSNERMFIVYVIESKTGKRYTGHCSDLGRRLAEHESGFCRTTKTDFGWKVVYTEKYATRGKAMKREKWLKSGAGRDYLNRLRGVESAAAE
jgi:putative endonuclease